jgi:hypothetical protein
MRSLALVLPASLIFVASVQGQALTEHAAAAAGAAIGVGAGKSLSNSLTKIFGDTDKETAKAAKPETKKQSKSATDPAPDPLAAKSKAGVTAGGDAGPAPFAPSAPQSSPQPRRSARKPPQGETAATLSPAFAVTQIPATPAIVEPIVKVPTVEDVASIKVGTTESDLVAALGQPSSRVIIPDDDGHLRVICQYWANGRALGTIRLDNGQVVTVETWSEN